MGNNCLQSNQTINQKEKVIHINDYTNQKHPNKQILPQTIQNLSQNLDTFEEDFFKNEFIFDNTDDNITNNCSSKYQLEKMEDVQQNIMQCPSLNFVGESQIDYQINLITIKEDPLNNAFIKQKKKQEKRSQQKNKKQFKKPVLKQLELKSILKQNKSSPSSISSFSNRSGQHSVTFNLSHNKINNKNTRSRSPILQTKNQKKSNNIHTKSMIFMQQFRYL